MSWKESSRSTGTPAKATHLWSGVVHWPAESSVPFSSNALVPSSTDNRATTVYLERNVKLSSVARTLQW